MVIQKFYFNLDTLKFQIIKEFSVPNKSPLTDVLLISDNKLILGCQNKK